MGIKQMKMWKFTGVVLGLCVASAMPVAAAPAFDSSGNDLLNGNYYFREVFYVVADTSSDISRAISFFGNISFNGSGGYTVSNATVYDSQYGSYSLSCYLSSASTCSGSSPVAGTYTMAASGYGYIVNAITGDNTFITAGTAGTATGGILTGSTTEGGYNDMFLAGKITSSVPTASTFSGTWTMAGFIPGGTPAGSANLFFQMSPNGAGSLGTVNVSGYVGSGTTTPQVQTSANVTYTFSSGAAVISFPNAPKALYFSGPQNSGPEYLYFSPDNSFAFGGSPIGFDMLVGVRNDSSSTTENFSGIYFQNGIDQDVTDYSSTGAATFDSYYGALSAIPGGSIIGMQRLFSPELDGSAYSLGFSDVFPGSITGSGAINDVYTQYAYSDGGTVRIGSGIWPSLGLTVAVQAPVLTGPTGQVFINPQGVVNAGSSAPFLAPVSNGELVTLYGSNLAASGVSASGTVPYQTTLGGATVYVNGQAAPLVYVSPGQISLIIPYENPFTIAAFQVVNSIGTSNSVTEFVGETSIGLFTNPPGGLGNGALLHNSTGALVTAANPAVPGEYIQAFLSGLGAVFPSVADGAPAPSINLATSIYFTTDSTNQITVDVGGVSAPVVYAGLAPGFAGLYQIDFQVPAGVTAGQNNIDIYGPDSVASQAVIQVGAGSASSAAISTESVQTPVTRPKIKAKRSPAGQWKPAHFPVPAAKPASGFTGNPLRQ